MFIISITENNKKIFFFWNKYNIIGTLNKNNRLTHSDDLPSCARVTSDETTHCTISGSFVRWKTILVLDDELFAVFDYGRRLPVNVLLLLRTHSRGEGRSSTNRSKWLSPETLPRWTMERGVDYMPSRG